jgi:hypothetical protein
MTPNLRRSREESENRQEKRETEARRNLCFNALHLGYAAARKQIDSAMVDQVLSDLEMNPLDPECVVSQQEPLALPRTPIILYPGSFKADLDPQQGDSNDVEEGVIEFEVIPTEPVPQGPQVPPPAKTAAFRRRRCLWGFFGLETSRFRQWAERRMCLFQLF